MTVQPRLLNLSVYINEHLRDDLTLELVAARMNLSPFHFHRKFRAYFGESLHQHIKRLRLERAAHELLHRLRPVGAVARASGYKTLSAFSHAFSAHFGVAPTRFYDSMLGGTLAQVDAQLRDRLGDATADGMAPTRIERLPERSIVFLRAAASSDRNAVQEANEALRASGAHGAETVIATSDLYGLMTGTGVRLDVGRDALLLDPKLRTELGQQILPAGRYAVFDMPDPAMALQVLRAAYRSWVPRTGARPRIGTHFLSCGSAPGARLYVPLEDELAGGATAGFVSAAPPGLVVAPVPAGHS